MIPEASPGRRITPDASPGRGTTSDARSAIAPARPGTAGERTPARPGTTGGTAAPVAPGA